MNKEISAEKLNKLMFLILDSDGVLIPRGTKISQKEKGDEFMVRFSTKVISYDLAEKIKELSKFLTIYISSGRSMIYLQAMYARLGNSVGLIAENGSVAFDKGYFKQLADFPYGYFDLLNAIREDIKDLPILGFEPKQFILTVHCEKELREVYEIVARHDVFKHLKVMWNGEAFDIQYHKLSKASGLEKLEFKREEMIAIGDRVNDKEMIEYAGIGVSADKEALPAEYWVEGKNLGGEILVNYLLNKLS